MTNIDRLREIAEYEAREHLRDFWRVNLIECYGDTLADAEIDEVLRMIREEARIPATPRVISALADLEALDPQTILDTPAEAPYRARDAVDAIGAGEWEGEWLPAVVIATGDQVRAARQALEAPMPLTDDQTEVLARIDPARPIVIHQENRNE